MAVFGIALVGAALSSYAGFGAAIGFSVASAAAQYFLGGGQKVRGPRQTDLQVQTSIYGSQIRLTYGSDKIAGQVIWQTERDAKKKTIGKGGGGGYIWNYKQSAAISFGEGVRDILAIWADQKVEPIYDARSDGVQKKYKAPIRLYRGTEDQLPDPAIEKDRGVGNAPAFRGLCYALLEDFPTDDFGGRLPNFTALVVQEGTSAHAVTFVYDDLPKQFLRESMIMDPRPGQPFLYIPSAGTGIGEEGTYLRQIDRLNSRVVVAQPVLHHWGDRYPDIDADGYIYASASGPVGPWLWISKMTPGAGLELLRSKAWVIKDGELVLETWQVGGTGYCRVDRRSPDPILWFWTAADLAHGDFYIFSSKTMILANAVGRASFGGFEGFDAGPWRIADVVGDGTGSAWVLASDGYSTHLFKVEGFGGVARHKDLSDQISGGSLITFCPADKTLIISNGAALYKYDPVTREITKSLTIAVGAYNRASFHIDPVDDRKIWIAGLNYGAGPVGTPNPTGYPYQPQFTEVDLATLTVLRTEVFYEARALYPVPQFGPGLFFNPVNALFDPETNSIWAEDEGGKTVGRFSLKADSACVSLQSVVEDLSRRVGLIAGDHLDASALADDLVCGYVHDQRQPVRQDLEALAEAYFFGAAFIEGKLKFFKRGGGSIQTIPEDDLRAHGAGDERPNFSVSETYPAQIDLPRRLDVQYRDEDRNYEQGNQHAARNVRNVASKEEIAINLPMVFTADQARAIAERHLYDSWIEKPSKFSLPPKYLNLTPGDVVTISFTSGNSSRQRLSKVALGANFVIECEAVLDDAVLHTAVISAPGATPHIESPPSIEPIAPTSFEILDIPMLRETDNEISPYIVAAPSVDGVWRGTSVVTSKDGGLTWVDASVITSPAVLGFATTVLADVVRWTVWDDASTVTVQLATDEMELENAAPLTVLANQANYAVLGDELIAFKTAVPLGNRKWMLAGFLRGRRGTELAMSTHKVAERFVLLDPASVQRLTLATSESNLPRDYRAISIGDSFEDATSVSFTARGVPLRPYSPAHVTGARDGSNNLTIAWVRRSRFAGSWRLGIYPPVGEDFEKYEIDVVSGTTVVRTLTAQNAQTVVYSAANQTTDGFTPGNPITVKVYQLSATVGRGTPRQAII